MTDSTGGDVPPENQEESGGCEEERLRPFEGVRLSKGTDRRRGWQALLDMVRRRKE